MGTNAQINGKIKFGVELSIKVQEARLLMENKFYLTEFLLTMAANGLGLKSGDLWVIECFEIDINNNCVSFESEGKIQYNGLEAFLIFLSDYGCSGKVESQAEGETEYFIIQKGEVKRKSFFFDLEDEEDESGDPQITEEILNKEKVLNELD